MPVYSEGGIDMNQLGSYLQGLLFPIYGNLSALGVLGYMDMLNAWNVGQGGKTATGTQPPDVKAGTQPTDVNACTQSFLMNNGGPGAQALVNNFSLLSYVPPSGNLSDVLNTPAAETTMESGAVKFGLIRVGYLFGRVFGLAAVQAAAGGLAESAAAGASLATGVATVMDLRARYNCR
jgi:hypothetical protein